MERGERTTANRSAATPAWKPQRICKGKIDAMQAKSITGGQVRDNGSTYCRSQSDILFIFIYFHFLFLVFFPPPLDAGQ